MDLQLNGKRALITGGSRGIGFQVARSLRSEGVRVALAARDPERLAAAAARLGDDVVTAEVDTGDDERVRSAVDRVRSLLGGIDILVNCAAEPNGSAGRIIPSRTTDEQFWAAVNVKTVGYLRTARAVAPGMVAQGWGRIINVSGLAARSAGDFVATTRNVGVAALSKNLADELGPHGVNVTVVHPGMTETERTPGTVARMAAETGQTVEQVRARLAAGSSIGRTVTAEEVAWVITFLASPRAVAMNGDPVVAGGGAPGPIHY
ncbi:SDR family NAD(P)-dependent oxidoreductase [Actinoplanes sp. NPDC049265]|uniref:SDR family NAD(P)-dependent oxidoreductase n=1 Tax=Actinoplanes sp. NPDC049265 TaxID=3363902 RepID=UPI00371E4DAB